MFTSPARRARDTAHYLAAALGGGSEPTELASLLPGGSWRETLRAIGQEPADSVVALVGHEPELGALAGVLLFGAPAVLPLKKAGACSIEGASASPGAGRLRWLMSSSALRALARKRSKV